MINGKLLGKILWSNPDSSLSFASQDVTLNSSDYDMLEFVFRLSTDAYYTLTEKILKGSSGQVFTTAPTSLNASGRLFIYVNDTKYTFGNGRFKPGNSSSSSDDNSRCVPVCIIGYKTGLF